MADQTQILDGIKYGAKDTAGDGSRYSYETHITGTTSDMPVTLDGEGIVGRSVFKDVTLTLDTNIYADGDVLAEVQEVEAAMRVNGGTGVLQSIELVDKDDQGVALDLVFFQETASLGTENAAVSISDADAAKKLGTVEVLAPDYVDFVNSQSVTKTSVGLGVGSAADSTSIFVGAISRGTGTYTVNGITLRLFFLLD